MAGSRAAQGGGPLQVDYTIDPESLRTIMHMAKQVDPVLKREVYKKLRAAGDVAAQAARDSVTGSLPPKADNRSKIQRLRRKPRPETKATSDGSLRAAIAKGVRVGLGTGAKSKGIRVTSSDRYLPDDKKAMNRVYRLSHFRHPVFNNGSWAEQHGKDWFYSPIEQHRAEFTTAVEAALAEAANTLGRAQ